MNRTVGVDFDNTIVDYDQVIRDAAVRHGLAISDGLENKKSVRDALRQLPDGEQRWREVQAEVYGVNMAQARLADGVDRFFLVCQQHSVPVFIVSHKTEFAAADNTRTNLRQAAMNWMTDHKFFESDGLGMSRSNVYFEETRLEKLERIKQLDCTHFIDDLEETFFEESFPEGVAKILYTAEPPAKKMPELMVTTTWSEITEHLFHADN